MKSSRIRIVSLSFIVVLSLLTSSRINAESNNSGFVNITYLNGLTTDNIYDVCTDKNGCLWIGTETGLSKYNGHHVKNFFKEEMNIRSNIIKYLLCDRNNRIWIGSGNGVGIYDSNSKKFLNLEVLSGNTVENKAAGLFEDSEGTIWISLRTGGLRAVNPDTFETRKYFSNLDGYNYFLRMWFEPENDLYLVTAINGGLYYLDLTNESKTPFCPADDPTTTPFAHKKINGLTKVNDSHFCLSCEDGTLWLVDPYEKTYEQLPLTSKGGSPYKLRRVCIIGEDMLGIGHTKGLLIYDLKKRKPVYNKISAELQNKNVYSICGDLENGLIIGVFKDGVIIQQESGFSFSTIKQDNKTKKVTLKGSNVTGFAETNDTTIWISTSLKGLFRYTTSDERLHRFDAHGLPKDLEGVVSFRDLLWLRSSSGIYSLNPYTKDVRPYREGCRENSNMITTKDGKLIVLSDNKLLEFDEYTDSFIPVKEFKDAIVLNIGHSQSGTLVAMTKEKGLVCWKNGKTVNINSGKSENDQNCPVVLFEDSKSQIWSAPPESGVQVLSRDGFSNLTTCSGLASDVITNIIMDGNDNVLITTDRSLTKITRTGKIYSITKSDGLINYGFTRASAFMTSKGDILLGSRDGATIIKKTTHKNTLNTANTNSIEKIVSNGDKAQFKAKNKTVLKHTQNSFEITVSDIDPYHILSGRRLYRLEGYEHIWKPSGKDRKFSYQGLKSGTYVFRSYNPDDEGITIRINAHPLASIAAIIIYVMIFCGIMTLIIIYIRGNEIRKRKEKAIQMKVDLHQDKIDFFTNIAHEIKTPLTLITTPLNHLKNNPNIDEEARYDIDIMDKNASYLLSLARELLEFSKIERGKTQINSKPMDICSLINNIVINFREQNSSVSWTISLPDRPIWVMADKSATSKILNNLVFNAIKYTESFINIEVSETDDGNATFIISNDGEIIPHDMREKIFDSFVQYSSDKNTGFSKEGFGIGLSVAKTLANLQEGQLYMEESDDVNEFIFKLPLTEAEELASVSNSEPDEENSNNTDNSRNTILIAEDHPDLLEYIRKTFSQNYNVFTAHNGLEAYEMVKSQSNIDLIITDLKMPQITGMELCQHIKQNPTFSHILVVILSANLTPETKLESLKNGADAIIEKPFSMDFLSSRVENLIKARKMLIERISSNVKVDHLDSEIESNEEMIGLAIRDIVFLKDLNRTIQENYNNPDFSVDELAEALNISRSSLNRKMRDILNDTANNYIRDKRMEKAEELLRNSTMQINEICYKVGFQTPSYFIKCFRKKYGMSPNEYANSKH